MNPLELLWFFMKLGLILWEHNYEHEYTTQVRVQFEAHLRGSFTFHWARTFVVVVAFRACNALCGELLTTQPKRA